MEYIFDILRRHRPNRRFMHIPWITLCCFEEVVRRNGFASKRAFGHLRSCFRFERGTGVTFRRPLIVGSLWGLGGLATQVKHDQETNWEGEKDLVHQIAVAELALKDGDMDKAKGILQQAIKRAEEGSVYVGLSCAYDMLATIAFQQGEIKVAQQLLVKVIERLIQLGTAETDNQIVNFTLKLSRIYTTLGEDQLAETGFRNCLVTQLRKLKHKDVIDDETGVLWVSILFWYSKFLSEKGRYDEAKAYLDNAYDVAAQVSAIQPAQIMVILYNMSGIAFVKKDYDAALNHLINAVVIGRNMNNPDLPSYYVMIGMVYLQKGLQDQARVWCEGGRRSARGLRNKDAEKEALNCLEKISLSFPKK